MTDRELLRLVERSAGGRAGIQQLARELGLARGRERRLLLEHLARLTAAGRLVKPDRDHWAISRKAAAHNDLVAGRLDLHRDGFGFVRPNERQKDGEGDVFIPPDAINGAMQGDQVLVELLPARGDGRRAGRIVRVLTRHNETVVGAFHYGRVGHRVRGDSGNYVTPFDDRMTQPIIIPAGAELPEIDEPVNRVLGKEAEAARRYDPGDLEGLVVDVEITDWPTPQRAAHGRVIEVLGHADDFGVDVEMVIRKHHLPRVFPDNVLAEARAVAHLDETEVAARRDFRGLPVVTIDGETAKDFDDAVLVERDEATGGWRLQVHIADVSHYVRPGTALDIEARLRGNSVYFPDRAIPMLPQELSTDLCSLCPDEDRLVLSCLMDIDADGDVTRSEVTEGVIRSARRMTYTQVHAILEGDAATRAEFADLVPAFECMKALAELLHHKREERGSIDFDLPEPVIEFDERGAMQSVTRSERNWAHRLIEEFMLAANESVAAWIESLGVPSLYRIHEKPEPRRVVEFEEIAAVFGYSLGVGALPVRRFQVRGERREQRGRGRNPHMHEVAEDIAVTPRMYQKLSAKIAGKPEERILAHLMLRSLRQARYSEKNEGHFALATPCYTHFTSPIRRYPDLIVHRIAKAVLRAQSTEHRIQGVVPESELARVATETSETERRAADAERELIEWKKLKFMRDRVGEDFDALVMSVVKYGLFVELDDLFVEGLVPIQILGELDGDYYTYRENTRQIIGERSHRRFSIGQKVRVILDRVDAVQNRLQFSIFDDGGAAQKLKLHAGKPKAGTKKAKRRERKVSAQRQGGKRIPYPKKLKRKRKK